jgi:hypothetical protein
MSFKPRSMVLRANPVMSDTAARPPHPATRTSLAAHNRRPRSSRFEPSASHRSRIASRSIMLTLVPISPMTENHPHPSHYVASPGKTDSVIFAAVLTRPRGFLMIIIQKPAQPFATLHRPASSRLRVTRKQQDVVVPLMITLRMVMRNIFAQCQPQGALTDEKHLGQALI